MVVPDPGSSPLRPENIPGVGGLWQYTTGDPRICVAVLDGPADLSHSSFKGAKIERAMCSDVGSENQLLAHGTHVASIIFGQHESAIRGLAPRCRGLRVAVHTASHVVG